MRLIFAFTAVLIALFFGAAGAIGVHIANSHDQANLPAPRNVNADHGTKPGQVVISWDGIPEARFYCIGWASQDRVAQAQAEGRHWLDTFVTVDVANTGQTTHAIHDLAA